MEQMEMMGQMEMMEQMEPDLPVAATTHLPVRSLLLQTMGLVSPLET